MRVLPGVLNPYFQVENNVNFTAGGKKVAVVDKREVAMSKLLPEAHKIFDAFEKGKTVIDHRGQPVERTDLGDFFEIRGHGANQRWAIKSDQSMSQGKTAKNLQALTAKLKNMSIHRPTDISPTTEQADRLNEFLHAHFNYQDQPNPETLLALQETSRNVQNVLGCPAGSKIPIPGQQGEYATLI